MNKEVVLTRCRGPTGAVVLLLAGALVFACGPPARATT